MTLHICRHSSPDGSWLKSRASAPWREPLHLTENRLEFDLDQDLGLRSAQQYKRPNGRRITHAQPMTDQRRVRCARFHSEAGTDLCRTCSCNCGAAGWRLRPISCSKLLVSAPTSWNTSRMIQECLTPVFARLRAARLMTCCGAACLPPDSIPMNWLFRILLCSVISRGVAAGARAEKIVCRIWRAHRPVTLGQVGTIGATIVRTPWCSRCSWLCKAVQRQRRSANSRISPDDREQAS